VLPQPRLRFVLADDPGAGKTIMAGLLLKELKLRGVVDRALVVALEPLTARVCCFACSRRVCGSMYRPTRS